MKDNLNTACHETAAPHLPADAVLYDNPNSMRVQVLFFGGLREILACRQTIVECAGDSASLATVRGLLERRFPQVRVLQSNTRLALNEQFLTPEELGTTELVDSDVLAFIPPVTGG